MRMVAALRGGTATRMAAASRSEHRQPARRRGVNWRWSPSQSVEQAADGGAQDGGAGEYGGTPRHGVGKMFRGNQRRQKRLPGRAVERPHDAVAKQNGVNRPDLAIVN